MRLSELLERVKDRIGEIAWERGGVDPEIMRVCEDSRKVRAGDLFVARGGTKTDGGKFVADAIARGAVAAVVEGNAKRETRNAKPAEAIPSGIPVVQVGNVGLAGALMAHEVAGNPTASMKMIGITGTKGKTTVAYLLRSVLKAAGYKVGMIGTVEIDDGKDVTPADMTTPGAGELVELFGRMKANGVTHCVMEVSSHALHQHRVAGIDWAVAIFTNLTGDHLDYHKTMEEYAAAKAMLFEGLKPDAVAVVNADDKWVGRMVEGCNAKVVRYGVREKSGWTADIRQICIEGTVLDFIGMDGRRRGYFGPLVGKHNVYNSLSTVAAGDALGIDLNKILGGLFAMAGVPGRLQRVVPAGRKREEMPFQVFVDYAHTHDALENVLTALRATMVRSSANERVAGGMLSGQVNAQGGGEGGEAAEHGTRGEGEVRRGADSTNIGGTPMPRLICVFGCGGDRDRTKRPKMGAVAERLADVVIVTSDNPRTENPQTIIDEICAGFSAEWRQEAKISVEPDRRAVIQKAIAMAQPGDVVLLAGKGHENYQIIGTTKHRFDDVEEAENALRGRLS